MFFLARISQLESQLVETSKMAEEQVNLSLDVSSILQRTDYSEQDVEGLEKKIKKLTRELDMLRVEVEYLVYLVLGTMFNI